MTGSSSTSNSQSTVHTDPDDSAVISSNDRPAQTLRNAVRDLSLLAAERAAREQAIRERLDAQTTEAQQEHVHTIELIESEYVQRRAQMQQQFQDVTAQLTQKHEQDKSKAEYDRTLRLRQITEDAEERVASLKKAWQEEVWLTESVYEAAEPEPNRWFEGRKNDLDEKLKSIEQVGQQARWPSSRGISRRRLMSSIRHNLMR
ncbi:MAG: hypothetical protein HND57_00465 [Planctomycetes bacterium]|nr:hypothetical protein [Planctomycetota bacterium]